MASSDSAVDFLLECTICLCRFDDPRTLPCLHTFCLRCLSEHVKASRVGSKFLCPSCRKDCALPNGKVQDFPKNFLMNTLTDMVASRTFSLDSATAADDTLSSLVDFTTGSKDSRQCGNWEADDPHSEAVVFCRECGQNFCSGCRDAHKMFPATRKHVLTPIETKDQMLQPEKATAPKLARSLSLTQCTSHPDTVLTMYCLTCRQLICKTCAAASHHKHKYERLEAVVAKCRSELDTMNDSVTELVAFSKEALVQLGLRQTELKEDLALANTEVDTTAEKLCEQIRGQQATLKKRIADMGRDALEKTSTSRDDLTKRIAHLESFCSYHRNLQQHGREVDLIRHTPALREQLGKIRRSKIHSADMNLKIDRVPFTEGLAQVGCASLQVLQKQAVSESKAGTPQFSQPRLLYGIILGTRVCVTGLTLIGRHLFVTNSEGPNVWVYTPEGRFIKGIRVPGLDRPTGMARVSDVKRRIVLVENSMLPDKKQLHYVTLTADNNIKKHAVHKLAYTPEGVSADEYTGNVIVTSSIPKQLVIYDGKMVQKSIIQLSDITFCQPVAAVKTDYGFSVVDFFNSKVALLDEQGQLLHRYGQEKKLLHPQHVVRHPSGLLVADKDKHRILLLTQELPFQQYFIQGVGTPTCLFWDNNTERLYVGQEGGATQSVIKVYTWQGAKSKIDQSSAQNMPAVLTDHYTLTLKLQRV